MLRYVLIYDLEVSFNFHLTFLQLNVVYCFLQQEILSCLQVACHRIAAQHCLKRVGDRRKACLPLSK